MDLTKKEISDPKINGIKIIINKKNDVVNKKLVLVKKAILKSLIIKFLNIIILLFYGT